MTFVKKASMAILLGSLLLTGCRNETAPTESSEQEQVQAEPVKQETEKQEPAKNENCEMKGEEFIQKSRDERRAVIIGCRDDHPRGKELYDVEKALNVANQYFTTSESFQTPVNKFIDDFLDGNFGVNYLYLKIVNVGMR